MYSTAPQPSNIDPPQLPSIILSNNNSSVSNSQTSIQNIKCHEGRIKAWIAEIPEPFLLQVQNFFNLAKSDSHVNIFDRHRIRIEHDTNYLSKMINSSPEPGALIITKNRLGLMRNIIYLYLAYNQAADYHSSMSFIAYVIMNLDATEGDNFCIFAHLVENILSGYFLTLDNYKKKLEIVVDFHLLVEAKNYRFTDPVNCSATIQLPSMLSQRNVNTQTTSAKGFIKITNLLKSTLHSDRKTNQEYSEIFLLMQTLVDNWIGMLFTNILKIEDCLELWDYVIQKGINFLYQFGLTLLKKRDSSLIGIIEAERMIYHKLGITDPHLVFSCLSPLLIKILIAPLNHNEFKKIFESAKDQDTENFVKSSQKFMRSRREFIVRNFELERLQYFSKVRKDLKGYSYLLKPWIKSVIRSIDELDFQRVTLGDLISVLQKHKVTDPNLAVKIFMLIDVQLQGYVEKSKVKTLIILFSEGSKQKIEALWEDVGDGKKEISFDEATYLLQLIDETIIPSSTQISTGIIEIYRNWLKLVTDEKIPLDRFMKFIQETGICRSLIERLEIIDGKDQIASKKAQTLGSLIETGQHAHREKLGRKEDEDDDYLFTEISVPEDTESIRGKDFKEETSRKKEGPLLSAGSIIESARRTIKSLARSLSRTRDKPSHRDLQTRNGVSSPKNSNKTEFYQLLNQTMQKPNKK